MSHRSARALYSERGGHEVRLHAGRVAGQVEGLWRDGEHCFALAIFSAQEDHAQKKTAHAAEQRRSDVNAAREAWFDGQLDLDPERLVFIDETGANTKLARLYGRSPRPAMPRRHPSRTLENNNLHGRIALRRSHSAAGPEWPNGRRCIPRLDRTIARALPAPRRHRDNGQLASAQS